jgi:hypothetical protein
LGESLLRRKQIFAGSEIAAWTPRTELPPLWHCGHNQRYYNTVNSALPQARIRNSCRLQLQVRKPGKKILDPIPLIVT